MARECSCCTHPQAAAIDAALVSGQSARSIAAANGLDRRAVDRHRLHHLPIAIRRAARVALEAHDAAASAAQAADMPPIALACPAPAQAAPVAPSIVPAPSPPAGRARRRNMELDPAAPADPQPRPAPIAISPADPAASAPAAPLDLHIAITGLQSRALAILAQAEADGDAKTALVAIRETRGVLETLARLQERTGGAGQAAPLAEAPEWHRTRGAIVAALAPFPEARLAVAEALVATGVSS